MRVGRNPVTPPIEPTPGSEELTVLFVGTPHIELAGTHDESRTHPVDIDVVTDGRAAIQRLTAASESPTESPRPDLVLLQCDFELPDGMTVLHAIKSSPLLDTVPVVVLDPDDTGGEPTYEAGGNAYIRTPHTAEEYAELIRSIEQFWFEWAAYPGESLYSDT